MTKINVVSIAIVGLCLPMAVHADEITLPSTRDNTLFEDSDGLLSNGSGQSFFAGRVGFQGGGLRRRGLIKFDLDAIPERAVIEAVELSLTRSNKAQGTNARVVGLHRVLRDWGEAGSISTGGAGGEGAGGPAQFDDATWIHTFFDGDFWNSPGGDFLGQPSASQTVSGNGRHTWNSTPGLVGDVQGWLDDPGSNFGWLLLGDESGNSTAQRFDSREHPSVAERPELRIVFSVPPPPTLEFSAAQSGASETEGLVSLSVVRTGNMEGDVSVAFASRGLTATAGEDFDDVSGVLEFGDGIPGPLSIDISILDDDAFEGQETIELMLSEPTGGAVLGANTSATITIDDPEDLTHEIYFAQFGNGGGLFSQITLLNSDPNTDVSGRLFIRDNDGQSLELNLNGENADGGRRDLMVPASSLRVFETDAQGAVVTGSVTIGSDGPLTGVILFGGAIGLAGVPTSQALTDGFLAPLEISDPGGTLVNTGIAVQNLEEEDVVLDAAFLDADGLELASAVIPIPGLGHVAQFATEIFPDAVTDIASFRGILRVRSGGARISATVIQTRPNQFATLPVDPLAPE